MCKFPNHVFLTMMQKCTAKLNQNEPSIKLTLLPELMLYVKMEQKVFMASQLEFWWK